MEDIKLTPEEEEQFNEEFAKLSGTNDKEEEIEVDNSEEESEEDSKESDNKKESKTEKKIKKLLSKKNQAIEETKSLAERLESVEKENERNKFLADFPNAKQYIDKIEEYLEGKSGVTREDAFFTLQGRGEIRTSNSSGFIGRPSSKLSENKDIMKGTTNEMKEYLKANFDSLPL